MSSPEMPSFDTLQLSLHDGVATLTLNRPERLNAAPPRMFGEIGAALAQLPGLGARALLITGAGRAFCSGADLMEAGFGGGNRGDHAYEALTGLYAPAMRALAQLPLPVVCAVNGAAAGIGCSLALAGDFVVAARSAYFLHAFVNIGLVPDGGTTWMLPRQIGKARAMQMMMLGERIPAEQAEQWGLIYRAVDDDAVLAEAGALAQRLAQGPTLALGLIRQGVARALELDYAQALQMEAEHQRVAGNSADAMEGGMAFLQRRKAQFQGR